MSGLVEPRPNTNGILTFNDSHWYIKRINTGNESSNYFQQENRWSVDGTISPNFPYLENRKVHDYLNGLLYLKFPKIDKGTLRTMLGLRKYICSQFKPIKHEAFI